MQPICNFLTIRNVITCIRVNAYQQLLFVLLTLEPPSD